MEYYSNKPLQRLLYLTIKKFPDKNNWIIPSDTLFSCIVQLIENIVRYCDWRTCVMRLPISGATLKGLRYIFAGIYFIVLHKNDNVLTLEVKETKLIIKILSKKLGLNLNLKFLDERK